MTQIIMSSNPVSLKNRLDDLRAIDSSPSVAVVEAEYGSTEVRGDTDVWTLNHHVRPERDCPCLAENLPAGLRPNIIGISHFDLDTLGGLMALQGEKTAGPIYRKISNEDGIGDFWKVAAFVDIHGPHRIKECPQYSAGVHEDLATFWAWSQENRLQAPRDGSCLDVTPDYEKARNYLQSIFYGDNSAVGREFLAREETLRDLSWRSERTTPSGLRVVERVDPAFVNHLYYTNSGDPANVVVAMNEKFKSITISCSSGEINCRKIVQSLWGELAGGHPGIAGSPRGRYLTLEDLEMAFQAIP